MGLPVSWGVGMSQSPSSSLEKIGTVEVAKASKQLIREREFWPSDPYLQVHPEGSSLGFCSVLWVKLCPPPKLTCLSPESLDFRT